MKSCDCCNKINDNVVTYVLPKIGYGSAFDCCEDDINLTYFRLCPDCSKKINRWIKKKNPELNLREFWDCEIYKTIDEEGNILLEEFKYEELLLKLFIKFMPKVIFGENYRLRKFIYLITCFFFVR